MKLEEIIRLKLEKLYKEYETMQKAHNPDRIKKLESDVSTLENLLKNVEQDMNNFKNLTPEAIVDILADNHLLGENLAKDKLLEDIRVIKLVLKAKYENSLKVEMTEKQVNTLRGLMRNAKEGKMTLQATLNIKLKELKVVEQKIEICGNTIHSLESMITKLNAKEGKSRFDQDEFQAFYQIMLDKDVSNEVKKSALIELKRYNDEKLRLANSTR